MKHFALFMYPPDIKIDNNYHEVLNRNCITIKLPKDAIGFRFFDRNDLIDEDGYVLEGCYKNPSPIFYTGEYMSIDDFKEFESPEGIIHATMIINQNSGVVISKTGCITALDDEDFVISV